MEKVYCSECAYYQCILGADRCCHANNAVWTEDTPILRKFATFPIGTCSIRNAENKCPDYKPVLVVNSKLMTYPGGSVARFDCL